MGIWFDLTEFNVINQILFFSFFKSGYFIKNLDLWLPLKKGLNLAIPHF